METPPPPTPSEEARQTVYAALAGEHRDRALGEIAAATGEGETETRAALVALVAEKRAISLGPNLYLSDKAATRVRETARRALATFHKQNPFKKVMPGDALRAALVKAAVLRDFNAAAAFLVAENVAVAEGHGLRLPDHAVEMPVGWQKPAAHILGVYEVSGLTPPNPGDFQANYPRDIHVPTILDILVENGALVRLEGNVLLHITTYEAVKKTLRRLAEAAPDGFTVGAARDALQTTRKMVLPLLEHLDAVGFTQRMGEVRVLIGEGAGGPR